MKKALLGLVVLPLLTGAALAKQPVPLTNTQMDNVTAGWFLHAQDPSNTSWTEISVWYGPGSLRDCGSCYLVIKSPALSVQSKYGPAAP